MMFPMKKTGGTNEGNYREFPNPRGQRTSVATLDGLNRHGRSLPPADGQPSVRWVELGDCLGRQSELVEPEPEQQVTMVSTRACN